MLSESARLMVDNHFGPHTLDMMSLDSNAQKDASGNVLKHFTPFPTPFSAGVNVFAQVIQRQESAYVLPPFLLQFLESSTVSFTIIVPRLDSLPFGWTIIRSRATSWIQLESKGDFDVLLFRHCGQTSERAQCTRTLSPAAKICRAKI